MCSLDCFTGGQLKGYLPKVIQQEQSQEQAKLNSNFFSSVKCPEVCSAAEYILDKTHLSGEKDLQNLAFSFQYNINICLESLLKVNYICLLILRSLGRRYILYILHII